MSTMEYMTVQEAALLLKVAPITIRRYIAQGKLPAVKVGKGVRVKKEAVDQLPTAVEPEAPGPRMPARKPKAFAMDDPLWSVVGLGESTGPTDVSQNKHKYLADAYATK